MQIMDWKEHITIDPKIHHGVPVIRGTRMPVEYVLGSLAGGMSFAEIQQDYDLTENDIRAALLFAQELVEEKRAIPA
jgi:uncharacterized protein (DUF433 family)